MSYDIIHILLLDGKILSIALKNQKVNVILKHLSAYLQIKPNDTFGLTYKDSRGLEQWLDESKMISDHDIAPCDQILQLVIKIRFIPHHVCQDESHIHQLILLATRLLRQNWFLAQHEIHSQLVALYLLSVHGNHYSDSDIHSTLIKCNISMLDPITKDNYFDSILDAYKIYRDKLDSAAEYHLKFLQLMMQFPVFNSKLFIIANAKGDKFLLGVNSVSLTVFYLDRYHEPIKKIDLKYVDNVMHRDIKIVISLKEKMKNQRNILSNETIVYFALSTHQSDCIYAEIIACWDKYKLSPPSHTIKQLMNDDLFKKRLNKWLSTGGATSDTYSDFYSNSVDIHLISGAEKEKLNNEQCFGELNMYDSDIYQKLFLSNGYEVSPVCRPMPDFDQMLTEEDRLKIILYEKLSELQQNCIAEKNLTGVMPPEYGLYFGSGNSRFTRNNNHLNTNRQILKGCAAEVKYKQINANGWVRTMSRDNLSYHSSSNIKASMSPSINANRMTASRSASDLRLLTSSIRSSEKNHYYPTKNSDKSYLSPASSSTSNVVSVRTHVSQSPLMPRGYTRNVDNKYSNTQFKKQLNSKY